MIGSIVLVDDETDLLESLAGLLTREFGAFTIKSTTSPHQAKQWIEAERPSLLITDVWMPGLSGLDLISCVSEHWENIPVILMTAYASEEVETLIRKGTFKYLPKPFRNQQLVLMVRDIVTRRVNFGGIAPVSILSDVIQLHLLAKSTGVLSVSIEGQSGAVWFSKSQIIHAVTTKLRGEEAFFEIFRWRGGRFSFSPQEVTTTKTIQTSATELLIEAYWRLDKNHSGTHEAIQTTEARTNVPPTPWYSIAESEEHVEVVFDWRPEEPTRMEPIQPKSATPQLPKAPSPPKIEEPKGKLSIQSPEVAAPQPEPKKESQVTMANNIKESLVRLEQLDGFLGAALVDSDSGMCLGTEGGSATLSLDIAAAANSEVIKAKRRAIKSLNLRDEIDDILISLGKQYHLIRPSKSKPALFFYVVLERTRANLALARIALNDIEKDLTV